MSADTALARHCPCRRPPALPGHAAPQKQRAPRHATADGRCEHRGIRPGREAEWREVSAPRLRWRGALRPDIRRCPGAAARGGPGAAQPSGLGAAHACEPAHAPRPARPSARALTCRTRTRPRSRPWLSRCSTDGHTSHAWGCRALHAPPRRTRGPKARGATGDVHV